MSCKVVKLVSKAATHLVDSDYLSESSAEPSGVLRVGEKDSVGAAVAAADQAAAAAGADSAGAGAGASAGASAGGAESAGATDLLLQADPLSPAELARLQELIVELKLKHDAEFVEEKHGVVTRACQWATSRPSTAPRTTGSSESKYLDSLLNLVPQQERCTKVGY